MRAIKVWDANGRERQVTRGQVVPAGWFHGSPPVALTREMRVVEVVLEGNPYDQDSRTETVLTLRPNISDAEARAEAQAEEAERMSKASALVGRECRLSETGKTAKDLLAGLAEPSGLLKLAKKFASEPGILVFDNTDPYYPRAHVEQEGGRWAQMDRWAIIHTTAAGRAAQAVAQSVCEQMRPYSLVVGLGDGDALVVECGQFIEQFTGDVTPAARRVIEQQDDWQKKVDAMPDRDTGSGYGMNTED